MKKVFLLFLASLCFGVISVVLWTGPAYAPPPGCAPVAQNLAMCNANLNTCNTDLAACEAGTQVFPGDGVANDPFDPDLPGHGPALSYTDYGDGTFTDNNTKFIWEKKLAANDVGGNWAAINQANRSVHCVNNTYTWTDTGDGDSTNPDGTLFTEFLAELNNSQFAGFSDWCIPNVKRLQSIVDYSTFDPASSVPGATQPSFYWSATTNFVGNPNNAWVVDFGSGFVDYLVGKDGFLHARAVRPCS